MGNTPSRNISNIPARVIAKSRYKYYTLKCS